MNIKQLNSALFDLGDVVFALDSAYMVLAYDELDFGEFKEIVFVVADMISDVIEMYDSDVEFALAHKIIRRVSTEQIKKIIESERE